MRKLKKFLCTVGISAVAFAGIGLAASPAAADIDAQPANTCSLRALVPVNTSGTQLRSNGGRGNCLNAATVTVALKRDITAWPDSTLNSETRQNIRNSYWNVFGNGSSGRNYYTQTDSSTGASLQSARMRL